MEKLISDDQARRTLLQVSIDGHDATSHLEPHLISFQYTDEASGKSDEVRIELHDRDKNWLNGWLPDKGAEIVASIKCLNWFGPGRHGQLNCGTFRCDEPAEYSGPPNKVSIKAVSASLTDELRQTNRTRGWEDFTLQGIASDIAQKNGLQLFYDAPAYHFNRQDQRIETDLAFLHRLAADRGVNLKIHDGKLIMFSAQQADSQAAKLIINPENDQFSFSDFRFKKASESTGYQECQVQYHDPQTKQLMQVTYKSGEKGKPGGKLFQIGLYLGRELLWFAAPATERSRTSF
ncbi:hypothetical protein C4J81_16415 [Deltaproteobacteria bacterium Smac51]|nr:hypothetical protein C4J81_16415 [Deltaproteobacteria bacterium Smac51]